MKETKVLFVSASASGYGGENVLYDVVTTMSNWFHVVVIAPEDGPLIENFRKVGVVVLVFPYAVLNRRYLHPLRFLLYLAPMIVSVLRLVHLIRKLKPDLVHTNNALILPGALAAKILGIPHVWHIREILERHHIHPLLWRVWRWIFLRFSDKVVCISTAVREQFGSNNKTIVIQDGVDTSVFRPLTKANSIPSTSARGLKVGLIGRIDHRRKGQDIFIEAASIVLRKEPRAAFLIVGDERPELKGSETKLYQMVTNLAIERSIEFKGRVPRHQMPELINDLDIVVVSSKKPEGLGIVLLEAMACGKPVIAPREGGPLDIIEDGVTGLLVQPRNPGALAEAIITLLTDEKLRMRIGEAARRKVEVNFSIEQHVLNVTQVYQQILKRSR